MKRCLLVFLSLFLFVGLQAFCVANNSFGQLLSELSQESKIPISFIVLSDPYGNSPKFTYLPNEVYKYKKIDLHQIKEIEQIHIIDEINYRHIKKKNIKHIDDRHIKPLEFHRFDDNFFSLLVDFVDNHVNKQCIGFKQENDKTLLYACDKQAAFIEKDLGLSLKKTMLMVRGGQKIYIPLKIRFISFSKRKLTKKKLNGVFGLITPKGKKKLDSYLNVSTTSVVQATIVGNMVGSFLGAKGTIGIPVSPLQKSLVDGDADIDLVLNKDEFYSFEQTQLPPDNTVTWLPSGALSVMKKRGGFSARVTRFPIIHPLQLLDDAELVNGYKRIWTNQIDDVVKSYKENKITLEKCKNELASLAYFCKIPQYCRYLWADESLKMYEILIPKTLSKKFHIGAHVAILSHPLLFTLNYAVVKIKGYTDSQAFVLNPELATRILRDQDGDTLSIVAPENLPLSKIHIPKKNSITTKTDIRKMELSNKALLELVFHDNNGIIFTVRSLLNLYIHLLENKKTDLFDAYKIDFARFHQASLDRRKKCINCGYAGKNLEAFVQAVYSEVDDEYDCTQEVPKHQTFVVIKKLKSMLKPNHLLADFERVHKLVATPTNIDFLQGTWSHLYEAMCLIS